MTKKINKKINQKQSTDKVIVFIIIFLIGTMGSIWYYQTNIYSKQLKNDTQMQELINKKEKLEKEIEIKKQQIKTETI